MNSGIQIPILCNGQASGCKSFGIFDLNCLANELILSKFCIVQYYVQVRSKVKVYASYA